MSATRPTTGIPLPPARRLVRTLLPLGLLGAVTAILVASAWRSLARPRTVEGMPVIVRIADPGGTERGDPSTSASPVVQAAGWIEPMPFPIVVPALIDGVVAEVRVLEGDRVERGQIVAILVAEDALLALRAAEADVTLKQAELSMADAERERADATLAALLGPDRLLKVAEAKLAAARAEGGQLAAEEAINGAELARLLDELARKRPLEKEGSVSAAEIVRLSLQCDAARAAIDGVAARRAAAEAKVAEALADLVAARRGRELLIDERSMVATARAARAKAAAELAGAEALRDMALLAVSRTEIRSPIDGIVLARLVGPGSPVSPRDGAAILSLYEPQRLQIRADVANADIGLVGAGMPATITVDALPDRTIAGTVRRVTAQADIQKNTVQVKIELHDPPAALVPEMLCRVRIGGASASAGTHQRLYAPGSLLRDGAALVARPDRDGLARLESRRVALGDARDGWIEVTEGLRPGELLVDPSAASAGEWVRVRNSVHEGSGGRDVLR